jgi:hypothetical protein
MNIASLLEITSGETRTAITKAGTTRRAEAGRVARAEKPSAIIPQEFPDAGTFKAIFNLVDASSRDIIGPTRPRLLVIPIHDDAGGLAGGLWGCTLFRWSRCRFDPRQVGGSRGTEQRLHRFVCYHP